MNRKILLTLTALLIIAAMVMSLMAYPKVPDRMATHWGADGQPDGWMNKTAGLIIMPATMAGLTAIFLVVLLIDPLRRNIDKFFSYYVGFIVIFNLFLLVIHGWTVLWNAGIQIPVNVFMPIAMACLFFYLGIVLAHVKPNWFIGIRTPWTLSNEIVWQKTHKLGAVLFKIAAIIVLIGAAFPQYAMWFIIAPVLAASGITIIYSLIVYKKLKVA